MVVLGLMKMVMDSQIKTMLVLESTHQIPKTVVQNRNMRPPIMKKNPISLFVRIVAMKVMKRDITLIGIAAPVAEPFMDA
jgi:hypothetical protein